MRGLLANRQTQTFRRLLLDGGAQFEAFLLFARTEFADDMVRFWIAVEQARSIDDAKKYREAARSIFILYIKSRRVKIVTAVQRKKIRKCITTPGKKLPADVFDEVQALVFEVIYHRVYAHFKAMPDAT